MNFVGVSAASCAAPTWFCHRVQSMLVEIFFKNAFQAGCGVVGFRVAN